MTDLDLLLNGGTIFPLPAGDKAEPPAGVTGKGASLKLGEAARAKLLDGAHEDANFGLLIGHLRIQTPDGFRGVIVIDEDNKPAREGRAAQRGAETIAALEARLGPLPRTLTSLTPGYGRHRLFWISTSILPGTISPKILTRDPALFGGVEVLTEGQYIVIPPSSLSAEIAAAKGYVAGVYRWEDESAPISELPDAWIEYLNGLAPATGGVQAYEGDVDGEERARRREKFSDYLRTAPPSIQGQGGDVALWRVCLHGAFDLALPTDDVLELVREHFDPRCSPPWGTQLEERVRHKCHDAKTTSARRVAEPLPKDITELLERVPKQTPAESDVHELPPAPWPNAVLPSPLRAYAASVAEFDQCPVDMTGALALVACAAACSGKVDVEVMPRYVEPLNLYTVVVLPPSSRKSPPFKKIVSDPLSRAQNEQQEALKLVIARAEERQEALQASLKKKRAERAAVKKPDLLLQDHNAAERLDEEIDRLRIALVTHTIPKEPRLWCGDVTMEALAVLLSEQGGRMALISAEGDLFAVISGRYAKDGRSNFELLLKAWGGDAVSVDRVSKDRPPIHIPNPRLTIAITTQPDVLARLMANKNMRGQGLLSRWLYVVPQSNIGFRRVDVDVIPEDVQRAWDDLLRQLTALPTPPPGQVPVVRLSADAWGLHRDFREEIELRLRPKSGDLADVADWAGKLPGEVARIAGLFHVVEVGTEGEISGDAMARAIELGRYFLAHAIRAFGEMSAPEVRRNADVILDWARAGGRERFTYRELVRNCYWAARADKKDIEAALTEGINLGHLAPEPDRAFRVVV